MLFNGRHNKLTVVNYKNHSAIVESFSNTVLGRYIVYIDKSQWQITRQIVSSTHFQIFFDT